ncbi:MAG TPA: glycogen synthase GlgA, partial [bacterium]|nr:glycogen synthase GlgA [bacterium]
MRIVSISSEVVPFAKTGGLADVAGTLPRELAAAGDRVSIVMPYYPKKTDACKFNIRTTGKKVVVPFGEWKLEGEILHTSVKPNVDVYFIGQPQFFNRNELYQTKDGDYPDNAERFTFFSRAAIEAMIAMKIRPDIVHVHDWQAALIPLFLKTHYKDSGDFVQTKTLLTIHNLGYQGLFPPDDMRLLNLGWEYFTFDKLEFWGKLNFLKAGIVYADAINTVSSKYASEILTEEFGCGLHDALSYRKKELFGILNGIDYGEWNPETDGFIARKFSASQAGGKAECKADLQKRFGIAVRPNSPLIGIVGRLTVQKGFDIVSEAMPALVEMGVQFAILGTGEKKYEEMLSQSAKDHPEAVGLELAYNNESAHRIEAGSDFFLMPSRYEPCGLNQMISLKYGTIPIVRATGGLDDSIVDFDGKKGTGFKFAGITAPDLVAVVGRALEIYNEKPNERWNALMKRAM